MIRINYLKIHDKSNPRCVSKENYEAWREMLPRTGFAGFCEDCTPEFQKEKAAAGLCDHPEVLFYRDKEGFVYGSFLPHETEVAIAPSN